MTHVIPNTRYMYHAKRLKIIYSIAQSTYPSTTKGKVCHKHGWAFTFWSSVRSGLTSFITKWYVYCGQMGTAITEWPCGGLEYGRGGGTTGKWNKGTEGTGVFAYFVVWSSIVMRLSDLCRRSWSDKARWRLFTIACLCAGTSRCRSRLDQDRRTNTVATHVTEALECSRGRVKKY